MKSCSSRKLREEQDCIRFYKILDPLFHSSRKREKVYWTISSKRSGTIFILFRVSSLPYTLPGRATDSRNICGLNKWILLVSQQIFTYSSNKYLLTSCYVSWIVLSSGDRTVDNGP